MADEAVAESLRSKCRFGCSLGACERALELLLLLFCCSVLLQV
jgi:hypothetical protein